MGSMDSMRPLSQRASTGELPPVEMATVTGARSTIAGMMTLPSSGSSTTLQNRCADSAARAIAALSSRSVVAATISQ